MDDLNQANPHALDTIVQASRTRAIVASSDIYDERGTKLLARGQPVSAQLQERLLERKLKQPLECTLLAADGVSPAQLRAALLALQQQQDPLAQAVQPWLEKLAPEVAKLPMHSAVQLLLTASQSARPGTFEHAVRAMALAGAIWLHGGQDRAQLGAVLLAGLLHDVGEMYVRPDYLNSSQALDLTGYRSVSVHPYVGSMVLEKMAHYPGAVVRAVREHHERGNGTGYPAQVSGKALSPIGRTLLVVEVALGIAGGSSATPWSHTSFALRMIPGEFDGPALNFVAEAARRARELLDLAAPTPHAAESGPDLGALDAQMRMALTVAQALERATQRPLVQTVAKHAQALLMRLRVGWNGMGLWNPDMASANPPPDAAFELRMACREFAWRLRFIRRECLWAQADLADLDAEELGPLWRSLEAPLAIAHAHA